MSTDDRLAEAERIIDGLLRSGNAGTKGMMNDPACFHCEADAGTPCKPDCPYVAAQAFLAASPTKNRVITSTSATVHPDALKIDGKPWRPLLSGSGD